MQYKSGNYEKYMTKNPLKRKMVQRFNNNILNIIGNYINQTERTVRILDAGCGEGFIDSMLLRKFPEIQITGVEYLDDVLKIAKEMNPEVTYVQGDITELQFPDKEFDIVLCTEVLEHIPNPNVALQELIRVTNKNLLITVPHEPFFCMGNLLVLKDINRLGNPIDHVNHWTKSGFKRFLLNNIEQPNYSHRLQLSASFPWLISEISF